MTFPFCSLTSPPQRKSHQAHTAQLTRHTQYSSVRKDSWGACTNQVDGKSSRTESLLRARFRLDSENFAEVFPQLPKFRVKKNQVGPTRFLSRAMCLRPNENHRSNSKHTFAVSLQPQSSNFTSARLSLRLHPPKTSHT